MKFGEGPKQKNNQYKNLNNLIFQIKTLNF